MSDMGDFRPGEVEAYNQMMEDQAKTIYVLSAIWYGLPGRGQPVTLGTFTTHPKAQTFLDKFRELDSNYEDYGDYNIFTEKLDPEIPVN